MRKTILALACGITSLTTVTAFAQSGTASAPEQLTMAIAWTGDPAKAVQTLLDTYNASHKSVHWNLVTGVDEQKLLAEEAAGNAPSVAMLNTTNLVATMATKGAILPLASYIKQSKLNMNQFTHASLYSNSLLGQQYALPFFEDTYGLYYNKALFKKAGIKNPPKTLEELLADAKKLTITGQNGQYSQLGFMPSFPKASEAYLFGGRWADASGHVTATSPATLKGVQWMVNVWKQFDPTKVQRFISGSSGAVNNVDPFALGKVGMEISGEWFMPTIIQQSPNLDYGVAPIPYPAGHPEYGNMGSVGGNPLVVLKGAQDPQQSWNLIDWLATSGEVMGTQDKKLFQEIYAVPALKFLVNDTKLAPTPQMSFFWKYSSGEHIIPFPPVPDATSYLTAIASAVQNAEVTSVSVKSALQQVQNQYSPLIASELKSVQASSNQ